MRSMPAASISSNWPVDGHVVSKAAHRSAQAPPGLTRQALQQVVQRGRVVVCVDVDRASDAPQRVRVARCHSPAGRTARRQLQTLQRGEVIRRRYERRITAEQHVLGPRKSSAARIATGLCPEVSA